jgi:hypothetical protein
MNLHKHLVFISLLLLGVGIAIAAPLGVSWYEQRQALSAAVMNTPATVVSAPAISDSPSVTKGSPRHITVPNLGIDTDVVDGVYDIASGQWTITEDSAFFATPTNLINSEGGNTLIYGHNSQKIFGKLLIMAINLRMSIFQPKQSSQPMWLRSNIAASHG